MGGLRKVITLQNRGDIQEMKRSSVTWLVRTWDSWSPRFCWSVKQLVGRLACVSVHQLASQLMICSGAWPVGISVSHYLVIK